MATSIVAKPSQIGDAGLVVVKDVFKSFGETKALNGCSFTAHGGEIHAIVGENGSGKSTLAKILSGVLAADSGHVSVFDQTPKTPSDSRRLGLATIFQEILVADEGSIADNLFVGTDGWLSKGLSKRKKYEIAREIMGRLALTEIDPGERVASLPLNIKQWIVIARALLTNPKVLILDESSAALDLDATTRLHTEMRRLRDAGCCVIIVTHRIAELVRISDRATVLRDGQVVGELAKGSITEHNLLSLMTPQNRLKAAVGGVVDKGREGSGEIVLTATGIKVHTDGAPFDFQLGRGEIVGITGLDGQGQDYFTRVVSGIAWPLSGRLGVRQANGTETQFATLAQAEKLGIAYVSGDRKREGIFPNLSIYENLAIALYRSYSGCTGLIKSAPIIDAYQQEVQRFSIKAGHRSNRITTLSGGNQQKVLIGRAFAKRAGIIVLNDPARGVDLGTKRELYDELRRHAASGGSVIYLSSEIEEFLGFADRVVVFHKGTVFRSLVGQNISEDSVLAAMFGHTAPVSFDEDQQEIAS